MKIGLVNILKSAVIGVIIYLSLGIVGSAGTLISTKVVTAPIIDGNPDAIWDQATAFI
ncbi:MAG: hypothetical protein WA130_00015 [Candidatus Methanoperedens sp.]